MTTPERPELPLGHEFHAQITMSGRLDHCLCGKLREAHEPKVEPGEPQGVESATRYEFTAEGLQRYVAVIEAKAREDEQRKVREELECENADPDLFPDPAHQFDGVRFCAGCYRAKVDELAAVREDERRKIAEWVRTHYPVHVVGPVGSRWNIERTDDGGKVQQVYADKIEKGDLSR